MLKFCICCQILYPPNKAPNLKNGKIKCPTWILAKLAMFNGSRNFITSLNGENFYFSSHGFQIWWLIKDIEVRINYKISAHRYLNLFMLD